MDLVGAYNEKKFMLEFPTSLKSILTQIYKNLDSSHVTLDFRLTPDEDLSQQQKQRIHPWQKANK